MCHLAGLTNSRESRERPLSYFDVNVRGTISLLQAFESSVQKGGRALRVVFASTHAVYGVPDMERPIREHDPTRPINAYGASKLAAEQAISYEAATGRIGAISLRCFNVSGAVAGHGDRDLSRVIPMALAVAAGAATTFPLNGDGSAVRDFVHVADVADAFVLAAGAALPGRHFAVNVGSGAGISMRELLRTIERNTGRTVAVDVGPAVREASSVIADVELANRILGWGPTRSNIEEIVRDAWLAAQPSR